MASRECLMHAGMRPINNIVDITNFVMMEYGQPIHAFDATSVAGGKIIVDAAAEGDKFTTLDGTERVMPQGTLMINDAGKADRHRRNHGRTQFRDYGKYEDGHSGSGKFQR